MKILIITGRFGSGHLSAAYSLAAKINRGLPQAQVVMADIYDLAFRRCSNGIYKTYSALMNSKYAGLVNLAYRKAALSPTAAEEKRSAAEKYILKRIETHIRQCSPQAIIATYSLAARLAADCLRGNGWDIPLVTCITDITIHNVWLNRNTDLYLAAAEETRRSLLAHGVEAGRIAVSGIPADERFRPNPLKKRRDGIRELLVMGGGLGMLPAADGFYLGLGRIPALHTTVLTGKNYKLYARLRKLACPGVEAVGYTERVHEYMQRADLLLSKPGGVTTFKALHCRLPLLVTKPVLAQEISNAEFIAAHGLGVVLSREPEEELNLLELLVKSEPLLAMIRQAEDRQCRGLREDAVVDYVRGLAVRPRRTA